VIIVNMAIEISAAWESLPLTIASLRPNAFDLATKRCPTHLLVSSLPSQTLPDNRYILRLTSLLTDNTQVVFRMVFMAQTGEWHAGAQSGRGLTLGWRLSYGI
jgi:hypothetical protein